MISKIRQLLQKESFVVFVVFVIAFAVYRTTMCPTVSFTDSGELATVATTLGIAHPTGYPLWTLLARLSTMIPLGDEEIFRLNTFACFLTALAVAAFFKLVLVLLQSPRVFNVKRPEPQLKNQWIQHIVAFVAALTLGFSSTVWSQSVAIEVYALHAALVIITTVLFVSGIEQQLATRQSMSPRLLLFSYVLGLSFANHMTTMLLAPGFLYLFFASFGIRKYAWRLIAVLGPLFVLGLSVYLYLPIRSASGPIMDWGHPVTLERFWWHVTGKQYQTWMFSGMDVVKKQIQYFLTNFPTEFQWPVIVLLLAGLAEAFTFSRRLLIFVMLLFVSCIAYSVNYDIHDVDSYFLLAYIACGCVLGVGIKGVVEWATKRKLKYIFPTAIVVLMCLPVFQEACNRTDVDQSENFQVADFVRDAYSQLEPNSVVFASIWDYFVSPSYYYQIVRKQRPDLIVIDEELLKNRTWYFIQLNREYPEFLKHSEDKVSAFLAELSKFEKGEPFDFRNINSRWDDLLQDLAAKAIGSHPVYVDPRIADDFSPKFNRIPNGLFVRLAEAGQRTEWKPLTAKFTEGTFHNEVTSDLKRYFATMYTYHSYWLLTQNRLPAAVQNVQQALTVDPGFVPALNLRARLPMPSR